MKKSGAGCATQLGLLRAYLFSGVLVLEHLEGGGIGGGRGGAWDAMKLESQRATDRRFCFMNRMSNPVHAFMYKVTIGSI